MALQIKRFILALHFYIFPFFCIYKQAKILPVDFTVRFVIAQSLMAILNIQESIMSTIGIALSEPERINSLGAPVTFGTICPFFIILRGRIDELPFFL